MVSRDYLFYLFKSKRVLVVFVTLIFLLLGIVSDSHFAYIANFIFATMLCFVLPCLLFMHVHDKRAVDTYYSLPLRREELLVSSLAFMLIVVYVPYTLSTVISILKDYGFLFDVMLFAPILGFTSLILINSYLFLLANNIFDGAVMIGAYEVLPLILFMALNGIGSVFVAGFSESHLKFIEYLSPVCNAAQLSYEFADFSNTIVATIISIIYIVIASVLLYRSYCNRKAERAGTSSTYILAYPTVISIYTFLIILAFTSSLFTYNNIFEAFIEDFIFYVVVFAIYIAAHFVSRRQFYFNYKMLVFFFGSIIVSLLLCTGLQFTRGFNVAYHYKPIEKANIYIHNSYYDGIDDPALKSYLEENFDYTEDLFIYLNIDINGNTSGISQGLGYCINEYRDAMINDFYTREDRSSYYGDASLYINQYKDLKDDDQYYYHSDCQLTKNQLFEMAKYPEAKVCFELNYGVFRIMPDGSLVMVETYYEEYGLEKE